MYTNFCNIIKKVTEKYLFVKRGAVKLTQILHDFL